MRAMGLDLGTKTIGVAVSDELGFTAQGLPTIRRRGPRQDLDALRALITEYQVDRVIIGLPLNMDGSEGPRAAFTRTFGDGLASVISPLPVIYQDERLTTVAAERVLLEGDVSRKKRREVIDQVAASLILQGWLDAQVKYQPQPDDDDLDEPST